MYTLSESIIDESLLAITSSNFPVARFPWKVELTYKDGGPMRTWYLGANGCTLNSVRFSESEKGPLQASLSFLKIDFPLYYGSQAIFYYNDVKMYRGYTVNIPSNIEDVIRTEPYRKRLSEITFNSTDSTAYNYEDITFKEILQDVLTYNALETGIYWNAGYVTDYTSTAVYGSTAAIVYKSEFIRKIIDDFYEIEPNAYEGVDANGFQYIRTKSTDLFHHILYSGENQSFQSLTVVEDYSKINITQYSVYTQNDVADESFVGIIPNDSTSYPDTDLQLLVGRKDEKYVAPAGMGSTEATDIAYSKLLSQRVPLNVKIKGVDLNRHNINIGDFVKIYDKEEHSLSSLINCESTSGWMGQVSLDTDNIEGDYSIMWTVDNEIIYDLGEMKDYRDVSKITFMLKSDTIGKYLYVDLIRNVFNGYGYGQYGVKQYGVSRDNTEIPVTKLIDIKAVGMWQLVEINLTQGIRYLRFYLTDSGYAYLYVNAVMRIDDIRVFALNRKAYEGHCIGRTFDLNPSNLNLYDIELGDDIQMSNSKLFGLEKKIKALEAKYN